MILSKLRTLMLTTSGLIKLYIPYKGMATNKTTKIKGQKTKTNINRDTLRIFRLIGSLG